MQKVINYFGILLKPRKMDDLFEKLKAEPPVVPFKSGKRSDSPTVLNSSAQETPTFSKSRMSPSDCKPIPEDPRKEPVELETTMEDSNADANIEESVSEEKKQMPTKAQQKLFEPVPEAPLAKARKVRSCKVRIKREDLETLSKKFASETAQKKDNSITMTDTGGRKRKTVNASSSPPEKKTRKSKESSPKKGAGFFIKLNKTLPAVRKSITNRKRSQSQSPTVLQKDRSRRINNQQATTSSSNFTTKATKFTRTQLIRDFGKRFFNLTVRMKRCKHPILVTFDSNVRARSQQRRKSKNLSVSFKEQVEIIDETDTESIYSEENNLDSKGDIPARLKKVENGKLIDNIELDSSQFIGEDVENKSSTPLRKKTEKKSYSPLKDDGSSSARSEQLKLANEKLPPCGLRLLRDTASEDDDDDDEEAEYIVPTDIPEKLSPRSNFLNNTIDSNNATKGSDVVSPPTTTDATESKSMEKSLSTSLLPESPTTEKESSISESNEKNSTKALEDGSSTPLPESNAEAPASDKKSSVKHVNGKRTGALTEESDSHSEKGANSKNDQSNDDENKAINMLLEHELFTPDSQDDTSESLVKKVIDILTEDIDLPEIKSSEESELPATVKAIATEITKSSNNI